MKYAIRNIITIVIVILILIVSGTSSLLFLRTGPIDVIHFIVGNETYIKYQTMNFNRITIDSSYIIFNSTGFYVTSGNDIDITLVYIHDDIAGAGDGDKVLEFYASTTGGNVWFNISGFPVGNDYVVNRDDIAIASPTANGSGYISFSNDVWSEQLFEIFQEGEGAENNPPYVPGNPNPPDEETDISINTDLSWTGGDPDPGDTVTYDVYLGTISPPPKMVSNQSDVIFDPELNYNTTYYWKIVSWDDHGASTDGAIWRFETAPTQDTASPVISGVSSTNSDPLDTETAYGWENFTCTVTDNTAVDEVKLILIGDTTTEYPMIKDGDDYYCNITISTANEYTYHIWADDTIGNEITSTPQPFDLPPNWDVNMDGRGHFQDFMLVAGHYGETGPKGWIREDVDNNGKVHFMDLIAITSHYNEEW